MSIWRAKRNLHKFVNMFFYLIAFILGFMLGGGNFEKINTILHYFY